MTNLLLGILGSLIATCIVASLTPAGRLFFERLGINRQIKRLSQDSNGLVVNDVVNVKKLSRLLRKEIRNDYSQSGNHQGQFGKSSSLMNEKRFQTGQEVVKIKPRMYMTYWPVWVLTKLGIEKKLLRGVFLGIRRLLGQQGWVYVAQSASANLHPMENRALISYRHTMSGQLIEFMIDGMKPQTKSLIAKMIDRESSWQNDDGGWAQCDRDIVSSDLWGSIYAISLLDAGKELKEEFNAHELDKIRSRLHSSLAYVNSCWINNGLSYSTVQSEENSVLVACQIGEILIGENHKLGGELKNTIFGYIDGKGRLSSTYIEQLRKQNQEYLSRSVIGIRVSFALWALRCEPSLWINAYVEAVEEFKFDLDSSDLSRMLWLTKKYQDFR